MRPHIRDTKQRHKHNNAQTSILHDKHSHGRDVTRRTRRSTRNDRTSHDTRVAPPPAPPTSRVHISAVHKITQTKHETHQNRTKYMKISESCSRAGRTYAAIHNNIPHTTHDPRRSTVDTSNGATLPSRHQRRPQTTTHRTHPQLDNPTTQPKPTRTNPNQLNPRTQHKHTDNARRQQEPPRTSGLSPPPARTVLTRSRLRPATSSTQNKR